MSNNQRDKQLYLIPVPLSADTRPEDVLPQSALQAVREIKCFFVENIRSARRFLKSVDRDIDIDALEFHIIDEHTTIKDLTELREQLLRHSIAAVISEAGCPAVADPGSNLVAIAIGEGYAIKPLVGPSSIILGLMASGFNGQSFTFHGYLPHEADKRKKHIREMAHAVAVANQTQIFIETPYRNNKLIAELASLLPGNIKLCVASNLTSPLQNVEVLTASQWLKAQYDYSKVPTIFLIGN